MGGEQGRPGEADQALTVLRDVWRAQGQDGQTLAEELGQARTCKRMSDVGFDDMAGPDGDLSAAWRATLQREGKRGTGSASLRDLVLGDTTTS